MKYKTYILTIKYNTEEDKPEFIKEELLLDNDVVIIECDDGEDLDIKDLEDINEIGIA